jgi:hypothetical protein
MKSKNGYYVFTPLSGDQYVKIHTSDCHYANLELDHPDRSKSWFLFETYEEAYNFTGKALEQGRRIKNSLNCLSCLPGK